MFFIKGPWWHGHRRRGIAFRFGFLSFYHQHSPIKIGSCRYIIWIFRCWDRFWTQGFSRPNSSESEYLTLAVPMLRCNNWTGGCSSSLYCSFPISKKTAEDGELAAGADVCIIVPDAVFVAYFSKSPSKSTPPSTASSALAFHAADANKDGVLDASEHAALAAATASAS